MDVADFIPRDERPEAIRARHWLLWTAEMRRRLDLRRRLDAGELRAWRESVATEPGARRLLILTGNRDMDAALVLWDFLDARIDWLERRAFAALGLHDGAIKKPTRPAALESLTPAHAAFLLNGDADGKWRMLFAGMSAIDVTKRKPGAPQGNKNAARSDAGIVDNINNSPKERPAGNSSASGATEPEAKKPRRRRTAEGA